MYTQTYGGQALILYGFKDAWERPCKWLEEIRLKGLRNEIVLLLHNDQESKVRLKNYTKKTIGLQASWQYTCKLPKGGLSVVTVDLFDLRSILNESEGIEKPNNYTKIRKGIVTGWIHKHAIKIVCTNLMVSVFALVATKEYNVMPRKFGILILQAFSSKKYVSESLTSASVNWENLLNF